MIRSNMQRPVHTLNAGRRRHSRKGHATAKASALKAAAHFTFYVLLCSDGSFYGGYSPDVAARVRTHNAGKGAKYTRSRLPVKLIYTETYPNKHGALSAEWHFKQRTRMQKEQYLRAHGLAWI